MRGDALMNKRLISAMYVLNIISQCILTLVAPAAFLVFVAWILIRAFSLEAWVYVPFAVVGTLLGFVSMIRFAISASEGLERLERANERKNGRKTRGDTDE